MEKEPQPDSLSDVTVKQYAASEVYSSEPPPAYHRPQSASVQIARIAAVTVVAVSLLLGGFILAAAYVNANASCQQLQQELQMLQEAADRMQPLQPEALIQEEPHHRLRSSETHAEQKEEIKEQNINDKEIEDNNISQESQETDEASDEDDDEDRTPIHIKLPLQLDFDELAGALMEKNQRSRMNCIVERKKAEEVVDHQAKTVSLPFGLNLTTDPRYERVTGERMAIFCESGEADQRQVPQQQEETMMVQPIVIPLPGPINLPIQFQGQPQQPEINPMRPPVPPQSAVRTHTIILEQLPQRPSLSVQQNLPPQANELPPHPLMQHIAQQIIAQHEMAAQRQQQEIMAQRQQEIMAQRQHELMSQRQQEIMAHRQQQEIAQRQQQEIAQRQQQEIAQRQQQEMSQRQQQEMAQKRQQEFINRHQQEMIHRHQQEMIQRQHEIVQRQEMAVQQEIARQRAQQEEKVPHHMAAPEGVMMPHRIPMPEEILSQINRLPNREVMVSVLEHEAEEVPQENVRVVQHPRESAQEMNGRQSYARGIPVHIPVPMVQQVQAPQQEENARPHYVQPRSVRSVDALLRREKRVKRCACDCAC